MELRCRVVNTKQAHYVYPSSLPTLSLTRSHFTTWQVKAWSGDSADNTTESHTVNALAEAVRIVICTALRNHDNQLSGDTIIARQATSSWCEQIVGRRRKFLAN